MPINIIFSYLFGIDSLLIYLKQFIDGFYSSFSSLRIETILSSQRFEIWSKSINMILEKPLLGWGAGTFAVVYNWKEAFQASHAHNLFLEEILIPTDVFPLQTTRNY